MGMGAAQCGQDVHIEREGLCGWSRLDQGVWGAQHCWRTVCGGS
jgi:hypothetical protein